MNRREFLMTAAATGLAGCAMTGGNEMKKKESHILFGACRSLKHAAKMKAVGFDFIENSVTEMLKPAKGEEEWKKQKEAIMTSPLPLRSCNGFLPGTFRITGEHADWAPILDYAEIACRRADEVGLKTIVFGSGGARNVPATFLEGGKREWPKGFGIQKGRDQYAEFCGALAKRIAGARVQIVIEPLCPDESNIINYVWQGMQIVDEVKSDRLMQLADLFHMIMGRESARSIVEAGDKLKHCHIASKDTRQYPGSRPDDKEIFKPYFDALKQIGYCGGVSCECGWPKGGAEYDEALVKALALMKELAS